MALLNFAGWECVPERDDSGAEIGWLVKHAQMVSWAGMNTLSDALEYFLIYQRLNNGNA